MNGTNEKNRHPLTVSHHLRLLPTSGEILDTRGVCCEGLFCGLVGELLLRGASVNSSIYKTKQ